MTSLLLSLTICLSVDGVDLGPVPLTDPPVFTATAGGATVKLSRRDEAAVRAEARERGLALPDLGAFRLVEPSGPTVEAALACGECQVGNLWKPSWYTGKATCMTNSYAVGPFCLKCSAPCPTEPVPIAEVRR